MVQVGTERTDVAAILILLLLVVENILAAPLIARRVPMQTLEKYAR
jgi:hypothetical protein